MVDTALGKCDVLFRKEANEMTDLVMLVSVIISSVVFLLFVLDLNLVVIYSVVDRSLKWFIIHGILLVLMGCVIYIIVMLGYVNIWTSTVSVVVCLVSGVFVIRSYVALDGRV